MPQHLPLDTLLDHAIDALIAEEDAHALVPGDHPDRDALHDLIETAAFLLQQLAEVDADTAQRIAAALRD